MLIVLAIQAGLIWRIFFRPKLLPWSRTMRVPVAAIGLLIVLVVVGLLNTRTPSGRVTIVARVNQIAPVVGGVAANVTAEPNEPVEAGVVLLEVEAVFGPDLPTTGPFRTAVAQSLESLLGEGSAATLATFSAA